MLIKLVGDESTPVAEIVTCIQSDPALSAQILKMANSANSGVANKVGSVTTAVRLLGLTKVKQVALSSSLSASFRKGQCKAFDYDGFWADSLARAVAARFLAQRFVVYSPDEAFTCGLMSQIGRLALATLFADKYEALCAIENDAELRSRERSLFTVDHTDLNAQLTRSWGMPKEHVLAVRHQHAPDNAGSDLNSPTAYALASLLHLSGRIAAVLVSGKLDARSAEKVACYRPLLGLTNQAVEEILNSIAAEWTHMGEMMSIQTPSCEPCPC